MLIDKLHRSFRNLYKLHFPGICAMPSRPVYQLHRAMPSIVDPLQEQLMPLTAESHLSSPDELSFFIIINLIL